MDRPLGAQISHMLKDRGVDVIFGIPGVHNQEMYRGIEEAGITHILARHEQGAGFMADGYARASGRPGVAYVITGPGLCNIMTPLGQAYSDSVPVLVISSCLDETALTRGQLHQMKDQRLAAQTVCDWSQEARSAEAAYGLIDRALVEFAAKRPRPKSITVPISALEATSPAYPRKSPAAPPQTRAADLSHVQGLLQSAQRPLFILGGGVKNGSSVARLLQASKAASFTTYAGRGLVPAQSPLHFGSFLGRPSSADVIGSADLVVAVGTELSEGDLWREDLGHQCPLVRVDLCPEVLCDRHGAQVQVLHDGDAFVADILALGIERSEAGWTASEVATAKARWRAEVDAERPGIVPVAEALRACVPEGTMIYSDMTQFAYAAKEVWDMDRPGHWHHPTGFGTLGYALPAAIGGAVARGGKPTLAIAGDYGLQYTIQELGTAVELGLSLPIVVWDNGKLGEIEDSMIRAQIAPNAVVQRNPDFAALGKAWGAHVATPANLSDLQQAVSDAFQADAPTLIWLRQAIL